MATEWNRQSDKKRAQLSFPNVSQSLSILPKPSHLNTQAEQGSQWVFRPHIDSLQIPNQGSLAWSLVQLCLYVLHGERKKDLDQKSGLGFKLGAPLYILQEPVLYINPTGLGLAFSFNACTNICDIAW